MPKRPLIFSADLTHRRALVIGAGPVGLRKAARLLDAGAEVLVVSPRTLHLDHDRLEHRPRTFTPTDLKGFDLIFACTNNTDTNTHISHLAAQRGLWCNVASAPSQGDIELLATTAVGTLQIAVGSGGAAPGVSQALRKHLARSIGPEWPRLTELTRALRAEIKSREPNTHTRTERLRAWLSEPLLRWLATDDRAALAQATADHLGLYPPSNPPPTGRPTVVITGFGPFPGVPINPSPHVAHAAAERLTQRFPHATFHVAPLPTLFDKGWDTLRAIIDPLHKDPNTHLAAILPLGVASRSLDVRLERVAINHRRGGLADASGRSVQVRGEPLDPWGTDGVFARLDVDRLVAEIAGAGHRIIASESAGTYICNEVFYKLITHCRRAKIDARAGFIHIPPVPKTMALDDAAEIVALIAADALTQGP